MTVTVQARPTYTGPLAETSLVDLEVDQPGVVPLTCSLKISRATVGPFAGWVLLCSGGPGIEHYDAQDYGGAVIQRLQAMGYGVVSRAWSDPWFQHGTGNVIARAGRLMEVVRWLQEELQAPTMRFSGSSGGSAELAYLMTDHGLDAIAKRVVFTGGPPFARLDYLCATPAPPAWRTIYGDIVQAYGHFLTGTPELNAANSPSGAGASVCAALASLPSPAKAETSIVHLSAKLTWPQTDMVTIFGRDDTTVAFAQGMHFFSVVSARSKRIKFVAGAGHWVAGTPSGATVIALQIHGGTEDGPGWQDTAP